MKPGCTLLTYGMPQGACSCSNDVGEILFKPFICKLACKFLRFFSPLFLSLSLSHSIRISPSGGYDKRERESVSRGAGRSQKAKLKVSRLLYMFGENKGR